LLLASAVARLRTGWQEESALDLLAEDRELGGEGVRDVRALAEDDVGGELEAVEAGAVEVGQGVVNHELGSFR
jgi:hypothetical protein